jgi:hypothetical protein
MPKGYYLAELARHVTSFSALRIQGSHLRIGLGGSSRAGGVKKLKIPEICFLQILDYPRAHSGVSDFSAILSPRRCDHSAAQAQRRRRFRRRQIAPSDCELCPRESGVALRFPPQSKSASRLVEHGSVAPASGSAAVLRRGGPCLALVERQSVAGCPLICVRSAVCPKPQRGIWHGRWTLPSARDGGAHRVGTTRGLGRLRRSERGLQPAATAICAATSRHHEGRSSRILALPNRQRFRNPK